MPKSLGHELGPPLAEPRLRRLGVAAVTAALCGCGGGEDAKVGGSILRTQINSDIVSSDPGMKRDLNTDAVLLHVVEGLVASREDGSVGPMLARAWTVSPDGRTYRFALRPEVRFHDGAPLTASDVVWSFRRYLAEGSTWRCKSDFGDNGIARVTAMTAPDPHTFELVLDRPAPLLLKTLARADCGGTGISRRTSLDGAGNWRQPVGTGPFEWSEWRRNQYVELKRYAGYAPLSGGPDGNGGGKRALVDRLRFVVIPDASSASAALLRGSVDLVDGIATGELGALEGNPHIRLVSSPIMDFYGLLFQVEDKTLADPRLRQAIALSLDIDKLTKVATRGAGIPDSSPIADASPFSTAVQRQKIVRDLPRARALAKAAGYRGEPITLIASHAPPEAFDAALIVQAMAREAGIDFELVSLDWASHLARYSSGNYQAMVFGYSARLDPSMMYNAFTGDKRDDPRKVWGTPQALDLLHRSQTAKSSSERQQAFDAMEQAFRADAPAVIFYNTRRITAMRDDVHGYRMWPAQLTRLWNVSVTR